MELDTQHQSAFDTHCEKLFAQETGIFQTLIWNFPLHSPVTTLYTVPDVNFYFTPSDANGASICPYYLASKQHYPKISAPRMAHATLSPRVLL